MRRLLRLGLWARAAVACARVLRALAFLAGAASGAAVGVEEDLGSSDHGVVS